MRPKMGHPWSYVVCFAHLNWQRAGNKLDDTFTMKRFIYPLKVYVPVNFNHLVRTFCALCSLSTIGSNQPE